MEPTGIDILLRIGDRRIVVTLDSLQEKFQTLCAEDRLLSSSIQGHTAVFRLFNKKFNEDVELRKDHKFQDGQLVSVLFIPNPKDKEAETVELVRDDSGVTQSPDEFNTQTIHKIPDEQPLDRSNAEYDKDFETGITSVEGGVCTTQQMRDPDSAYAAVTYVLNSFDAYSPAHLAAIESLKKKAEAALVSNEIESIMAFIAGTLDAKIVLFQKCDKTLVFNPFGSQHARIVFNPNSNHCDACITFDTFTGSDISGEDAEQYLDIRQYFTDSKWKALNLWEKEMYREQKKKYEYMKIVKMPIPEPEFMQPPPEKPKKKKKTVKKDLPSVASRTSDRLKGIVRDYADGEEDTSCEIDNPEEEDDELDNPEEEDDELDNPEGNIVADNQEGDVVNSNEEGNSLQESDDKENQQPKKPETNKNQTFGLIGTNIGYPSPLPTFSAAAIRQLKMRANKRKMKTINEECRVFVKNLIGSEYPSKKSYDNFCRTLVEKYPKMKDEEGTDLMYWATFKMSFRSSFRGTRSYEKNGHKRKGKKSKKKSITPDNNIENSNEASAEEAADSQVRSSKEGLSRSTLQRLLKASINCRKLKRAGNGPSQNLEMYPHLKIPEMMICDYLLQEGLSIDEIQVKFKDNVDKIGVHYQIVPSSEVAILEIESEGTPHLSSTSIQAPFLVALTKQDFCTGEQLLRSASILMENRLVNSLEKPKAEQAVLLLVAAYYTLNADYPKAYLDFMKALERMLIGSVPASHSRNRKASWNKFVAMLK
ncbi:hypothetical protein FOCC_FOCC003381 [Frankliniella occidentalis]|nr:hypothetical protein FOCC_FOCC003381 [Frankliniella occidentalis]